MFNVIWVSGTHEGKRYELNTIGVVLEQPRCFAGRARVGQRLECVDSRPSGDHGAILWFRDGKGRHVTMTAREAQRCMRELSGPRRYF